MSTSTVSLARLLQLDVPRSWHEVVAVVMEAGDAMKLADAAAGPDACTIDEHGDLRLVGSRHGTDVEGALTSLLASLLEGQSAPAELRALAAPSADGVDGLLRALAYFERPNRRSDISALATRALAAEAVAQTETELARLRSGSHATPSTAPAPASPTDRRRRAAGLSTVLLLLLAIAAGVFWYVNRPAPPVSDTARSADESAPADLATPSPARSLVSAASEAILSAADAGLRAIGLGPSEPAPTTPAAPSVPASPTRRATRAPEPAAGAAPPAVEPAGVAAPAPAVPAAELPVLVAEPDEGAMAPEPPPGPFTEADADVEPPVLVYPQLPSEPQPPPPASAPHFELLVNERGEVDQVRLRATDARFQDRMMVSAAKAWRFRPAMKDGKPVRYRVRVPIPR